MAYRTLGIAEDATYDEITEAHIELSERYVGDSPRLADLDDAMERVVNEMLRLLPSTVVYLITHLLAQRFVVEFLLL